jgi:acetyl esterase/lipase
MTDDRPSSSPSRSLRVADVQLRGRGGPLRARAYWPAPASASAPTPTSAPSLVPSGRPPLLVLFPRGTGSDGWTEGVGRGLCSLAGLVVLAVRYRPPAPDSLGAALDDATTATQWAADHAAELGADPGRLVVAGEGAGADLAATMARQALDHGWPPILRQVLVRPRLGAATLAADVLADLAPATVVVRPADGDDDDGRLYGSRLRRAGVPVDELVVAGGDGVLATLASSLRQSLAPSPAASGPDRDDAA